MGSMGAENLLTQKASYETKEGKSRGEALLDTWKGMMDTPVVLRGGVCWGGEVKPKKKTLWKRKWQFSTEKRIGELVVWI